LAERGLNAATFSIHSDHGRQTDLHGANGDQDAGIKIVLRALEEPLRQIVDNAGADPSVTLNRVVEGAGDFGFNALTNQFGDMLAMGIVDPCKVTRTALQNSASIAGLVLTTDCMIAREPEPPAAKAAEADMG
jgi:chaperonin GroEL